MWPRRFLKKKSDHLPPPRPGRQKKLERKHTPLTSTRQFGAGDTGVAGVGNADGSRAKYNMGF